MQQRFGFTKNSVRAVLLATIMPLGFFAASMAISFVIIWFGATSMLTIPVSYYAYLAVFYIVFAVPHLFLIIFFLNKIRQRFSLGVMLDDEGIWHEQTGKTEGLVPWSKISRIKDSVVFRHSHLLDDNSNTLLTVDYFLQDFRELRDIITEKIYTDVHPTSQTFVKTLHHQLIYIGSFVACLGISTIGDGVTALIMLFIIGVLVFEYLTTAHKISLTDKHFVLGFPLREEVVPFTEIADIKTTTRRSQESRLFQIGIFVKGRKKPYCLTKLGIDDRELLVILRQATGIK